MVQHLTSFLGQCYQKHRDLRCCLLESSRLIETKDWLLSKVACMLLLLTCLLSRFLPSVAGGLPSSLGPSGTAFGVSSHILFRPGGGAAKRSGQCNSRRARKSRPQPQIAGGAGCSLHPSSPSRTLSRSDAGGLQQLPCWRGAGGRPTDIFASC